MSAHASPSPSTKVCACCGATGPLHWDHILPKARGGSDAWQNMQRLCDRCNQSKGTGPTCRINHTKDLPNDSKAMDGISARADTTQENHSLDEDPLERLTTRLHAQKKKELLKLAESRGVAAGVIIEEWMDLNVNQRFERLEGLFEKSMDAIAELQTRLQVDRSTLDEGAPLHPVVTNPYRATEVSSPMPQHDPMA